MLRAVPVLTPRCCRQSNYYEREGAVCAIPSKEMMEGEGEERSARKLVSSHFSPSPSQSKLLSRRASKKAPAHHELWDGEGAIWDHRARVADNHLFLQRLLSAGTKCRSSVKIC